jgi:hypothetical protein
VKKAESDSDSIYFTPFYAKAVDFEFWGEGQGRQQYSIDQLIRQLGQLPLGHFLPRVFRATTY